MPPVLLDPPKQRWECPNCDYKTVTQTGTVTVIEGRVGVHRVRPDESCAQMHRCRGLAGLLAPMVPAGVKAKVEAREREDYVRGDMVRTDDNGRVVMSVVTTRDDGQDCAVFAPAAVIDVRGALS